jgi:hypothetical protein
VGVGFFYYSHKTGHLQTYYAYSPTELAPIENLTSTDTIMPYDLDEWDDIAFKLVRTYALTDVYVARLLSYLYTAQRDVAFLSYNHKNSFKSSIDPISAKILCHYFTKDCEIIKKNVTSSDPLSEKLANIVMVKVLDRMQADEAQTHLYPAPNQQWIWQGQQPYAGQSSGSWKTWLIKSGQQFRVNPPPSPDSTIWSNQLAIIKNTIAHLNDQEKLNVIYWAGGPGTLTLAGKWVEIVNDYCQLHRISLKDRLLLRATLAMGIADVLIASYDSQYTYWVKRPLMRDSYLQPMLPNPNHPSYPAAHSAIAATVVNILTKYLPNEKKYWLEMANASGKAVTQSGINYPLDEEQGFILGNEIGKNIISKQGRQINAIKSSE